MKRRRFYTMIAALLFIMVAFMAVGCHNKEVTVSETGIWYLVCNGKFDKTGYDNGTRYFRATTVQPTGNNDYKIFIAETKAEADAEILRLNKILNSK